MGSGWRRGRQPGRIGARTPLWAAATPRAMHRPGAMRSERCGRRPSAPVPPRRAVPSGAAPRGEAAAERGRDRDAPRCPRTDSPSRAGLPVFSAFSLCKWLQHLEHRTAPHRVLAVIAAGKAVGAGTESHRQELLTVRTDLITPDLLPQLHLHWLLEDGI